MVYSENSPEKYKTLKRSIRAMIKYWNRKCVSDHLKKTE